MSMKANMLVRDIAHLSMGLLLSTLAIMCVACGGLSNSTTNESPSLTPHYGQSSPEATPVAEMQQTPSLGASEQLLIPGQAVDMVYHQRTPTHWFLSVYGLDVDIGDRMRIAPIADTEVDFFIQPDSWSPSGEKFIVFERRYMSDTGADEPLRVYLVDSNRNTSRLLFSFYQRRFWDEPFEMANRLLWSPDGDRLIFGGFDPNTNAGYLRSYDLATDEIEDVVSLSSDVDVYLEPIGWSPNGREILYLSNMDRDPTASYIGALGLYRMNLETGTTSPIYYDEDIGIRSADVSPIDPNLVVLKANGPEENFFGWNLFILDISSTHAEPVFDSVQEGVLFAISPDGAYLSYSRVHNHRPEVCFRHLETGQTICAQDERLRPDAQLALMNWLPDSQSVTLRFGNQVDCGDVLLASVSAEFERVLISSGDGVEHSPTCGVFTVSWNPAFLR